ncbi:hypothetical protein [Modestobacter sp. SYSU DS0875]
MADLLVVTGPPGSGKSTVAPLVAAAFETAALVPGDSFFAFWSRGFVDPWLPEARAQNELVLRAAGAAVGTLVAGGCPVVYDGVLGPWLLPAFADAAGLPQLHYAVLLPSLATCLARVAGRAGHGFTDPGAAAHMHAEFTRADIATRHVLASSSDDPQQLARLLLDRYRDGALSHRP